MTVSPIKAIRGLLLFLLIVLPFLPSLREVVPIARVSGSTLMGFSKEIVVLTIVGMVFGISLPAYRRLRATPTMFLLAGFLIWGTAHILSPAGTALAVESWRWQFLYPLMALALLVFGINGPGRDGLIDLKLIGKIVAIQAAVISVIAIIEIIHPDIRYQLYGNHYEDMKYILSVPGLHNVRSASTLGNPINLGVFLLFAILYAGYLLDLSRGRMLRVALIILIFMCVAGIVLTLSRTAYLILFVLGLVSAASKLFARKISSTGLWILVLIPCMGILILPWLAVLFEDNLDYAVQRIQMLTELGSFTEDPRVENWRNFLSLWSSDWVAIIWGAGLGFSNSAGKEGTFIVENSFISILGELGLIGLILYALLLARMAWNSLRAFHAGASPDQAGNEPKFITMFLLLFLICSFSIDAYKNSPFSAYFWIIFVYTEFKSYGARQNLFGEKSNASG